MTRRLYSQILNINIIDNIISKFLLTFIINKYIKYKMSLLKLILQILMFY